MKIVVFFHVATIGNYQEIFDEIYSKIHKSNLFDEIDLLNICIVGNGELHYKENKKIMIYKNSNLEEGEFFTLEILKLFSNSSPQKCKILYIHTKGVTTPNNDCIVDWRKYMSYFNINLYKNCLDALEFYDSCGVDLVFEPTIHYSGNFWWANSDYIKKLPSIDEIRYPKIAPILSIRHNCEFWIGMGNGKLKSLWNSNINVYERHLHRYLEDQYK